MIGDVLTTTILLEYLKKKFPTCELHYLVNKNTLPILEGNLFVDKIVISEAKNDFVSIFRFIKNIRKENYTHVIDVYATLGTAFLSFLSGASYTTGYYKKYSSFLYTETYNRKSTSNLEVCKAISNRIHLLSHFNIAYNSKIVPKITLATEEIKNAKSYLLDKGIDLSKTSLYMISILGSGMRKTYPKNYMASLLDKMVLSLGQDVVLLFNYIPSQYKDVKEIYDLCDKQTQEKIRLDVYGKSLRDFLAITTFCKALVGNEGGAVNMAKALHVSTFSIFAPNINKASWALFEEEGKHESVHLKEYLPELYTSLTKSEVKENVLELYGHFTPNLFEEKMMRFL